MLGNGVSMLVGPYLVHYTPAKNATSFNLYSNSSSEQTEEDVERSIDTSLYHPKGQNLFLNFFMLKCFIGS